MNATNVLRRTCAHYCCKARSISSQTPATVRQQPSIRMLSSSTSRNFAQPIDISSSTPPSSQPFSPAQPELNNTHPSHAQQLPESHEPRDQCHPAPSEFFTGTVTRTGTMRQTVQVTRMQLVFDSFLQKHYTRPLRLRIHDPNPPTFLREGDVVEYSSYTQAEKDTKQVKDLTRIEFQEKKLSQKDKSGKAVRAFRRNEAKKKEMQGKKARGVQFVVRRVVTPFGVGIEQRMEQLSVKEDTLKQPRSSENDQNSLLRGMRGNTSRQSGRAAVAG